jgi:hypothetical protein
MHKLSTDEKVILMFKLLVDWKDFKSFCNKRTTCKDCPYFTKIHTCSACSTETVLSKSAEVAREYLKKNKIIV